MPKHPQYGMKGSKPRPAKVEPPPDTPAETARKNFEANAELDRKYKILRNRGMDLKTKGIALELALKRETLIEKDLARNQLRYLLLGFRSKLLSLPQRVGARFGRHKEPAPMRQVLEYLDQAVRELLEELADMPNCVEKDWMKRLEEEEER
jgi:hypothetical protein